jgi:ferrous iron transport protein A
MNTPLIPLTHTRPGQRIRVSAVDAGQGLRSRLCAMGLTPGMSAHVIAIGSGPVILDVLGTRLVLGQGMAAKVLVRAVAVASA